MDSRVANRMPTVERRIESKKKKVLELLRSEEAYGTLTAVANGLKISRKSIYDWMAKDSDFADEINEIRESVIDKVEASLVKSAVSGNVVAQIFYLKNNRPLIYAEKKEVSVKTEEKKVLFVSAEDAEILERSIESLPEGQRSEN
tara:strand:+ start:512 stop:946 length:435 start_codon:yes stop_codon:yes gene_type:complete